MSRAYVVQLTRMLYFEVEVEAESSAEAEAIARDIASEDQFDPEDCKGYSHRIDAVDVKDPPQ